MLYSRPLVVICLMYNSVCDSTFLKCHSGSFHNHPRWERLIHFCHFTWTSQVQHLVYETKQKGIPGGASGKESTCQCSRGGLDAWVRNIPWRRRWQPTPVFLPGESQGQRSPAGYSPRVHKRVGQELVTKQQQMRQKVEDFSGGYIVPRVGGETRLSIIQFPN